ncbi:polyprenyl synthetase family protein [Streptomyces sp. MBT97]|uniref:polyprenyl synthetase family protein n=1 Tax=Streptomyces sp. MBT97 TaxID=2800411 RepID=UPI00190DD24D|nr:polyprenyl synthetase family protein [Streptomyces sp. MBT97]MBK3632397.1 polyprenyl synthetase family protein [Streptomyces sp. MBT97]
MRPSKAKDHHAAVPPPPGPSHASRQTSAAGTHPRPVDFGTSPGSLPEGAVGVPLLPDVSDLRAIDDDVPAAVGRLLGDLLAERTAQAAVLDQVFAHDLAERVARFTLDGGKRTRSQFVWWALRACGGEGRAAAAALRVGAALELIQTCALVHDDVMDGSRLRRGRPALHADVEAQYAAVAPTAQDARFGEAAGILAGDLALAWADDVLADTELAPDTARRVRGLWSAMRMEMVAGQYLDVQGQITSSRSSARAVRAACLKSALYSVERPLALGAGLAGADAATTAALCSAGRCVGIAFQLRDDLNDVFGSATRTGKPSGDDIRSGKPTYLVAVAQARAEAAGDRGALSVLRRSLGRADLSETGLAEVRGVLVATGARETVEARIERLAGQGMRHLDSVTLRGDGRLRLRALLRSAAGAPPAGRTPYGPPDTADPSDPSDPPVDRTGAAGGASGSLLLTAGAEGATR